MTVQRRISLALALMVILPLVFLFLSGLFIRFWIMQGGKVDHFMRPGGFVGPLLVFGLYTLMNGFLSWWVARRVTKPLSALQVSALEMGEGDLTNPVLIRGDKEISDLSQALEKMRVQLQTSLTQQEAHLQARKELISHVSHDLRTPLSLIRGYAEGLRDQVPQTPEARDRYIHIILDRAQELEKLIQQLLDFSNMDAWKQSIPREPKETTTLFQNLVMSFQAKYPSITFNLQGFDELPPDHKLLIHEPSLERILTNLTENSLHHSGADSLTIHWTCTRGPEGFLLRFQDNGTTANPDDLPQLFEPLFRGDKSRGRGGSGLGLTIVSGLMEAQGGKALSELEPGGGLEVILQFLEAKFEHKEENQP
jgi:signal transduction histidine kinase